MFKNYLLSIFGLIFFGCELDDGCIDTSKIKDNSNCTEQYQSVCGCDGITYDNDCIAERAGVTDWTEGECKWKYIKWK